MTNFSQSFRTMCSQDINCNQMTMNDIFFQIRCNLWTFRGDSGVVMSINSDCLISKNNWVITSNTKCVNSLIFTFISRASFFPNFYFPCNFFEIFITGGSLFKTSFTTLLTMVHVAFCWESDIYGTKMYLATSRLLSQLYKHEQ